MTSLRKALFAAGLCVLAACSSSIETDGDDIDESDVTATYKPGCTAKVQSPYALGGSLLLPTGPQQGWVVIENGKIANVVFAKPMGMPVVDTNGVIAPGLIDLHNHVAYDNLPLWNSGKRFQNRYQWAGIAAYGPAVKDPYNAVKNAGHQCEQMKFGELRAIVGGTTTIQGSVDIACSRSWVRNVEFTNFCQDKVRQNVLPISNISQSDADALNVQFANGTTKAFFVHLAEGIDDKSRNEFEQLRTLGLLKPQVVGIHSTALADAQLQEMAQIGMKIVWSPLSNLILYGHTTNIPAALKYGITVALAPDWSPSGSSNLLGELKVADRVNKERFGGLLTDKQLVDMATTNAAKIVGWDDRVGKIQAGYSADLVVIRKHGAQADCYRSIIDAVPGDVLLSIVDGDVFYGDPSMVQAIGQPRSYTPVDACGEGRVLGVQEPNTKIPNGMETLDQITQTFANDGVSNIAPLFQCTPAPDWAFAGTVQGVP